MMNMKGLPLWVRLAILRARENEKAGRKGSPIPFPKDDNGYIYKAREERGRRELEEVQEKRHKNRLARDKGREVPYPDADNALPCEVDLRGRREGMPLGKIYEDDIVPDVTERFPEGLE